MQIYIPNLWITGATFDCGKFGSAELTPVERRENLYDVDVHVSRDFSNIREEERRRKDIIEDAIRERIDNGTFEPNDTTHIESDVEELYALAYLEN